MEQRQEPILTDKQKCTRGVSIGCAVVEDANSNCCRFWMRMHLKKNKHNLLHLGIENFAQHYFFYGLKKNFA